MRAAALALILTALPAVAVELREAHYVMGTLLEMTVEAPDVDTARSWIRQSVAEARRLDRELTSFDPDSALSRLNRGAGSGAQRVPPDLFRIVAESIELSRGSGGAFDVTVGPLVEAWREAARRNRPPDAAELAASRSAVGYEKIRLRFPDEIELATGMSLELGGIGKGYGADRLVERLRALGATAALVSFGESSIVAVGAPAGASGWPIWVRRGNGVEGPLELRDAALSTSRSLGRTQRIGGRRVGHLLDPRTGQALDVDRQATVVAPTATEAEAWSKALILDPTAAFAALARRSETGGLLFAEEGVRVDARFALLTGWSAGTR